MATVYIVYSGEINKYYVGSTDGSVEVRLKKHLSDHKGYTGKAKDWKIIYTEKLADKNGAIQRERQIKSWKSRAMIEKLIKSII